MALALAHVGCADEMRKVAPRMAEQIREAVAAQRGRKGVFCPEALQVNPSIHRLAHLGAMRVTFDTKPLLSLDFILRGRRRSVRTIPRAAVL